MRYDMINPALSDSQQMIVCVDDVGGKWNKGMVGLLDQILPHWQTLYLRCKVRTLPGPSAAAFLDVMCIMS